MSLMALFLVACLVLLGSLPYFQVARFAFDQRQNAVLVGRSHHGVNLPVANPFFLVDNIR